MKTELSALQSAIKIVGGQANLARLLADATNNRRIRQGHVWQWLNRSHRAPPEMAIPIEQVTNGQVTRHQLRPDVFGAEAPAAVPAPVVEERAA